MKKEMTRLVRANRKSTVTQIITVYKHGKQKCISEHTILLALTYLTIESLTMEKDQVIYLYHQLSRRIFAYDSLRFLIMVMLVIVLCTLRCFSAHYGYKD